MKNTRIYVTATDIKEGLKGHVSRCPIARAVGRKTKAKHITVCSNIMIDGEPHKLLRKALWFMERFDAGKKVKPFSFVLREVI